ncbi:hypothetical protein D3C85_1254520 [compost metagenome]
MDQLQHRALFEDIHAKGLRKLRFAQDQIQRMQMPRTHIDQATGIHTGIHHLLTNLLRFDQAGFVGVTGFLELCVFSFQTGELRRGVG